MNTTITHSVGPGTSATNIPNPPAEHGRSQPESATPPPSPSHAGPLGELAGLQGRRTGTQAQASPHAPRSTLHAHAAMPPGGAPRHVAEPASGQAAHPQALEIDAAYDLALARLEQGEAGLVHGPDPAPDAQPVAGADFPRTPAAWQQALAQETGRACHPGLIADVLNDIRCTGSAGIGVSHSERLARITPEHVANWRQGLGLTARDIGTMERNARIVGAAIPTSSTVFNAVNYGMFPWLTKMGSKDPINNAIISIVAAGIAQPVVTAVLQTFVVAGLDTFKKRNGITWMLDSNVNAATTPAQAAAALDWTSRSLRNVERQLDALYRDMGRAYDVPLATDRATTAEIVAADAALAQDGDVDRRVAFAGRRNDLAGRKQALTIEHSERSDKLCMATSMHARQSASTQHQVLPRTARSATSFATPVGQTIERHLGHQTNWPTVAGVVAAAGAIAWQHRAASQDEVDGAFHYEEKQNMLYGLGYLTPAGVAALRAGQAIQPGHIDEAGLRRLAPGPATQMRDRVVARLDKHRVALGDAPGNLGEVQACVRDAQLLRAGRLTELTPGGKAQRLLDDVIHRPFKFAISEGYEKFSQVEFKGQLIQRTGVAWTMGVAGNVGATAGSRLVNGVLGGAKKAPLLAEYSGATLSTAMGFLSAMSNYMAVNVKNELRAAPERVKARWQVFSAIGMPVWQAAQWHARTAAHGHAEHAAAGVERFALDGAQPAEPARD